MHKTNLTEMKQATTVEQQIETLKNRGMQIDMSEEKTKEIFYPNTSIA